MKKIFYLFIITSFIFTSCKKEQGCTDPLAYNYNINAEEDNNSCIYDGCTDILATNYSPSATIDNGDCIFSISGGSWINQSIEYNGTMTVTFMNIPVVDSTINYIETNPDSLEPYKLTINDNNTYTEFDQSNNSIEDGTWSLSGDQLTINTPDTTLVLTILSIEKNTLSMDIDFIESGSDEGTNYSINLTQKMNFNREW